MSFSLCDHFLCEQRWQVSHYRAEAVLQDHVSVGFIVLPVGDMQEEGKRGGHGTELCVTVRRGEGAERQRQ